MSSSLPPGPGQRLPFPPSEPPGSDAGGEAPDPSLKVGDLLEGGYQIESRIGEGGVGAVYRALQLKLNRHVAVKLLLQDTIGEEELRPRFQQEALTLAAFAHPHIVTLQDYGMARGRPFLVMELLQGRTLREILDTEGALAPVRTLTLLRQVVLALAYAHELGVVHRDLKPANLIVQALPGYEHVKVLDFGMVKLLPGSALDRGHQLTRQGFTFGTPGYMSPEHALGGEVDGRSDLYAVGVLLFELLTAQKPFDGEVQDILRAHLTSPVPQLAGVKPELLEFPELQRLVERAMAKEVDERFADAKAFLAAIDELLMSGLMADQAVDDAQVHGEVEGDERAHLAVAPKLRDTLEAAAAALSSYARASRGAWQDKASPQLRRARRELAAAAFRLAPRLRRLSHTAWGKLRPQLVRGAERLMRVALDAKQRIEARSHAGAGRVLALPAATESAVAPDQTLSVTAEPAAEADQAPRVAAESAVASDPQAPGAAESAAKSDLESSVAAESAAKSDPARPVSIVPAVRVEPDVTVVDLPPRETREPRRHAGATLLEGPRAFKLGRADETAEPLTLEVRVRKSSADDL